MKRLASLIAVAAIAITGLLVAPAGAAAPKPRGDAVTAHIVDAFGGTKTFPWRAKVLNTNGYGGKRAAVITRYESGIWVGVIHVTKKNAPKVKRALRKVYYVRKGGRFVVPLKNRNDRRGSNGEKQALTCRALWEDLTYQIRTSADGKTKHVVEVPGWRTHQPKVVTHEPIPRSK